MMALYDEAELAKRLRLISVFIDNGLNQDISVQLMANREKAYAKAVISGTAFLVPANNQKAVALSSETSGWLPYMMVQVSCTVAPTSGTLTIYRLRSKDDEVKLVDALRIRDTQLHDASTDADKVLIVEW